MTIKQDRQYRVISYLDGFRELIGSDGRTISIESDPEESLLPEDDNGGNPAALRSSNSFLPVS